MKDNTANVENITKRIRQVLRVLVWTSLIVVVATHLPFVIPKIGNLENNSPIISTVILTFAICLSALDLLVVVTVTLISFASKWKIALGRVDITLLLILFAYGAYVQTLLYLLTIYGV